LRDQGQAGLLSFLDGKPLPVGGCSKDPDAKVGRGAGRMAKGYKLHTLWGRRVLPEAWEVTPLNTDERPVGKRLLGQAPGAGYVLADGNYDSSELFDEAARQGYQLVVPMPDPNAGKGHRYQSPFRKRCIELLQGRFGQEVFGERRRIEQAYGNATSFGGGLGPLPAWVRGLERVRTWVWAKLLINAVRILKKQRIHHLRDPCTMLCRKGDPVASKCFRLMRALTLLATLALGCLVTPRAAFAAVNPTGPRSHASDEPAS
jgi:hypothetical protein